MPDRDKCLQLIRDKVIHKDRSGVKRLVGAVGLLGGRPDDKAGYHAWIREHSEWIVKVAERNGGTFPPELVPERWQVPGLHHKNVWTEAEYTNVLKSAGFSRVESTKPQTHGRRDWRDMRLEAVK